MLYVSDVSDLWPSLNDFSEDIGVPVSLIRVWRHRKSIPSEYWAKIEERAERRGIQGATGSDLARIAANRSRHLKDEMAAQ